MNKHLTGLTIAAFSVIPALIAGESEADKPQGFRFFNVADGLEDTVMPMERFGEEHLKGGLVVLFFLV